ncbi:YgaP family membrane protein [Haloferax denitrificans]|uniref:YgaP family membrane protein n=1 Tax=Haloferax denitrificans TaxID=35745 RepID=UPI003C6F4F3B
MVRNVGTLDRTVRLALGALFVIGGVGSYAGLFSLGFGPVPAALGAAFVAAVGVVLLATGFRRTCPLYLPFGIDTSDDRN